MLKPSPCGLASLVALDGLGEEDEIAILDFGIQGGGIAADLQIVVALHETRVAENVRDGVTVVDSHRGQATRELADLNGDLVALDGLGQQNQVTILNLGLQSRGIAADLEIVVALHETRMPQHVGHGIAVIDRDRRQTTRELADLDADLVALDGLGEEDEIAVEDLGVEVGALATDLEVVVALHETRVAERIRDGRACIAGDGGETTGELANLNGDSHVKLP